VMPLNYASWKRVSGWRWSLRRRSVAVGRRTVRLIHDLSANSSAALLVSAVVAVPIVGLCFMQAVFNPAGQVGSSWVLADRADYRPYDVPEDDR
jgi:hypothetical protein